MICHSRLDFFIYAFIKKILVFVGNKNTIFDFGYTNSYVPLLNMQPKQNVTSIKLRLIIKSIPLS